MTSQPQHPNPESERDPPTETTDLVDGRYVPWHEVSQAPNPDLTNVWAKLISHYDPETDHLWVGDWLSTATFDDVTYIDVVGTTGQVVRVSGATDERREHRCLMVHTVDTDEEVIVWEPISDETAIDLLDPPSGEPGLRIGAREAIDHADAWDLCVFVAIVQGPDVTAETVAETVGLDPDDIRPDTPT